VKWTRRHTGEISGLRAALYTTGGETDRQTDSGGLTGGAVKRGPFVPCHGQRRRPGRDLKIDFR
jgi:hypothetical protein